MPINKIRYQTDNPTSFQGEWGWLYGDRTNGGLRFTGPDSTIPSRQIQQIVKVPLAGATVHAASGGVVAWQNPEPSAIMITRVVLDITTVATAACTLDVGVTATSASTTSDTLLDGVDANAAIAVFDSGDASLDSGANAKTQKLASGKWVTIDEKTGDATGLVANLYIHYFVI